MRLPSFSRTQTGVILLLAATLFLLFAWRDNFFFIPSPPPARTLDFTFVEITGDVPHPGVYSFPQPPTLTAAVQRAGRKGLISDQKEKMASGSRIEVTQDGRYQISRMLGEQLLALGLALDLNTATLKDLEGLPGIGPALARRIIEYRQAHGPFQKIADLEQVSGIGPKKLEKITPYVIINVGQEPAAPDH